MFEKSVLLAKANKETFEAIFEAPLGDQIEAYKATLKDLESFLTSGDLTQVTMAVMNVIKIDVLNIITGLWRIRDEKPMEAFDFVGSVDGILDKLGPAKLIIFNTEAFFDSGKLEANSRALFYTEMEACRVQIKLAREAFQISHPS